MRKFAAYLLLLAGLSCGTLCFADEPNKTGSPATPVQEKPGAGISTGTPGSGNTPAAAPKPGAPKPGTPEPATPGTKPATKDGGEKKPKKEPTADEYRQAYRYIWGMVGQNYHLQEKLAKWSDWEKPKPDITDADSFNAAVEAMLSSLGDRWTHYTSPKAQAAEAEQAKQGVLESGIELLREADGGFSVHYLTYGSPAYNVRRIHKGDRLLAVNGKRISGMQLDEVEALLKGSKGTTLNLVLDRTGTPQALDVVLVPTEPSPVTVRLLPPERKVLYVRFPDFMGEHNEQLMLKAFSMAYEEAGWQTLAIALDLRGNPGGRLDMAIEVAEDFLNEGEICTMTSRDNTVVTHSRYEVIKQLDYTKSILDPKFKKVRDMLKTAPMYVLVDGSSASCSEILSGALKDNGRATLIGKERTYGKGVAYRFFPLPVGGQLTITTGHYLTPGKRGATSNPFNVRYIENPHNLAIEGGITPHIYVEDNEVDDASDAVLVRAVDEARKSSLISPARPIPAAVKPHQSSKSYVRWGLLLGLGAGLVAAAVVHIFKRR